jgi:S-formylglutathione hydrolase FrmB
LAAADWAAAGRATAKARAAAAIVVASMGCIGDLRKFECGKGF